jgi:hypothetical protein
MQIVNYSDGKAEGIYVYRLNLVMRGLTYAATTGGVVNPSFLALDPRGGHLWEVIW